ncbi:MAG: hybrid sensor histidine kinase/response regulator [Flavobacterium sp.]|nr:MAG: hybrid sensor histidine kinase/response regulator [Flavobacterium sp.]
MRQVFFYVLLFLSVSSVFSQNDSEKKEALRIKKIEERKNFQKLLDSSNAFYDSGDYSKSFDLNMKILPLSFKIGDNYFIHQAYRYLAYDYLFLNDTILAMDSFKKSESYAKLSKNDTATAVTYMDLGNVYSTQEDYKRAYIYFNRSINLFEKINDSVGIAKAHYNLVLAAIGNTDFDTAYIHITKAKDLNKNTDDASFSINLDNFLGEYYIHKKEYEKADLTFLIVIENAKNNKLDIELENAYYLYSESLFEQGKYKEAYETFKIYDEYSDINSGIYTSDERYTLSQKFQLDEYRKDIEAANLNNKLQAEIVKSKSRVNIILIIVSAVFLILLIALYSASIKRIKLVKKLRIKNKEALKAKEESEKLSKAKVKFFSTVSHELRTPLYGVIGLSSVLLEDKSLKKHKKDLKYLKFSADYLLALINDVLQINKIDSEKFEEETTSFNLRELIETITSSFEYMRIQNDNQLHIEISDDIPALIRGNTVQLSQILMNLIGNACKFTENGNVYIKAKTIKIDNTKAAIKFTIKDTGIGIAKNKQDSVFDEFTQVDSLSYSGNGSGLGLPIVKKLLALSNSEIYLESELGKGALFTFTLTFEVLEKAIKDNSLIKFDASILKGKKILIVEDNRINQIVTQKILEQKDIICSIAENGEEAIEEIKQNDYDLVLMDINMPVKNGIEASKEIRKFNKTIPIIALTAVEIEEMRNNIYMSGMNDIVVKPYDISKFIDVIIKNISLNMKVNT